MIESAKTPTISVPITEDQPEIQEPQGVLHSLLVVDHDDVTCCIAEGASGDVDAITLKVSDEAEGDTVKDPSEGTEGEGKEEVKAKESAADVEKTETEGVAKEEEPDKTDSVSIDLPADQSESQGGDAAAESASAETVPPEGADQQEDEGGT